MDMPLRLLKILLHAGFFLSGISAVLIGQVLPVLSQKLSINDRQAGNFFFWQYGGSLCGTLFANWLGKRGRFIISAAVGCLAMASGIALLNFDSYEICVAGFTLNGFGIGLTLPAINMLILELNPQRSGAALSFLNFFWGFGAIISQPLVDFLKRGSDLAAPTLVTAAALALIGAALWLMPAGIEQKPAALDTDLIDFDIKIWRQPLAWAIALFGFIHVGFEGAMGGWLKTYTGRTEAVSQWFPPITLYFLFFVAGRGIAPLFFRFLDENKMLLFGLLTILGGMLILLFGESLLTLSVGASIAGFGTSWIFPTNLSRFTKIFGASATRRAAPLFISGTVGAMSASWLVGYISERNQDLRAGMFVLLFGVLLVIGLQIILTFQKRNA